MRDITTDVIAWVTCCNELWCRWFAGRQDGADRFDDVKTSLFNSLLARDIDIEMPIAVFMNEVRVQYLSNVLDSRQVCRRQKAGNIYCIAKDVSIDPDKLYHLRSIDPVGTMMDGAAYAEVVYDGDWILEPVDGLRYLIP